MKRPLIAGNSLTETISSEASYIRRTFNDYPFGEYTQVSGNEVQPYIVLYMAEDIVSSA
jgi:hypothetical protein